MSKTTLTTLSLAMALACTLGSTLTNTARAQEAGDIDIPKDDFSMANWLGDKFKLFNAERDHAENAYIQEFNFTLRMQYQMEWIDPKGNANRLTGSNKHNSERMLQEWRRFRMGWNAKLFNDFKVVNVWNMGGMEGRDAYNSTANEWQDKSNTYSLYELYVEYKNGPVAYSVGKMKPRMMHEYRTSSSAIITIERSILVNQLRSETNYGIQFNNSGKDDKLGWVFGTYLNGNGTTSSQGRAAANAGSNNRIRPTFSTATNAFMLGTLSYDTAGFLSTKKSRVWLDYAHNFANYNTWQADPRKNDYQGIGARDVVALSWEGTAGKFSQVHELMAGFRVNSAAKGAQNVVGYTFMPSYKFTPNLEGVLRYQVAAGSNAIDVSKGERQYGNQYGSSTLVPATKTVDCINAFYMGVNYYLFAGEPNMAKIMMGAEYLNTHGRSADKRRGPNGWTYDISFRTNF